MKHLTLCLTLALFALGCSSVGLTVTTTPKTPVERVAAAQADLTVAWRIANDAHDLGLLSDQQFKFVATTYPVAQEAINVAQAAVSSNQPDALALLDAAAKAVKDFRNRVPDSKK